MNCLDCGKKLSRKKNIRCNSCNIRHRWQTTDLRTKIKLKLEKNYSKTCLYCQKVFITKKKHQKYCSRICVNTIAGRTKSLKRGGLRRGGGIGKSGWYKGYWCYSTWELAFVIYHLDYNIKFSRNEQSFPYEFEGKFYKYYPDFIKAGRYYEIKGYETPRTLVKYKAVKRLKILRYKEISPYLEYVKMKYNVSKLEELYDNIKNNKYSIPASLVQRKNVCLPSRG